MTSVDGYTKAGADAAFAAIDHAHAGGGVVFKTATIGNTILLESASLGGTVCAPGGWSFPAASGSVVGMESSDNYGWGYDEAGIYQLTFKLWIGFPDVVPARVTFEFLDYNGVVDTTVDFVVQPAVAYRQSPGFSAVITTQFYYSPDKTVTGTNQSAHQIVLRCIEPGVTFKSGNGLNDDNAVRVAVVKL